MSLVMSGHVWQILIVFDKDEDPVFCQPRGRG